MKIAIVVDSAANLTKEEAEKIGWFLLPSYINIYGKQYADGIDINAKDFFDIYNKESDVKTSASNLSVASELFSKLSKEYDKVVVYPISIHLSSQYSNLKLLSQEFKNVYVVPSENICELMVLDIFKFLDQNIKTDEDFEREFSKLGKCNKEQSVLLVPKNTDFLLKSGRLTPAANAIAKLLHIVPIIEFKDGKLLKYGKGRKFIKTVSNIINSNIETLKKDPSYKHIVIEARCSDINEFLDIYKKNNVNISYKYHLSPLIAVHTGPESMTIIYSRIEDKYLKKLTDLRKKSLE
ncbi:DegV family protein [Mycoplasma elephantis]|uniref:DegV family protein n=1 Tax=Mycoplasma elephantis TaxID=114882 RepID=UPI000485C11D|nr:DegV family protein [Mycoplasma elephantis]